MQIICFECVYTYTCSYEIKQNVVNAQLIPVCLQFNLLIDREIKNTLDLNSSNGENLKQFIPILCTNKYLVQFQLQTNFYKLFLDENDGYFIPRNCLIYEK